MTKTLRSRKPTRRLGADMTQDVNYLLQMMIEQTRGTIWIHWPSRGQPAKALQAMADMGLVTVKDEVLPNNNRHKKRTYTITEEGKARHYRRRPKLEPAE